jgi:RNA polymerase sigma factor (TIGR02999 family)
MLDHDSPEQHRPQLAVSGEITRLLGEVCQGCPEASEQLLNLVYRELRQLARARVVHVGSADTLQPTELVHEAYLRLIGRAHPRYENRRHFFAIAARAMRDVVIEQARRHASLKHGGDRLRLTLEEGAIEISACADELLALDRALRRLELTDPRSAEVVQQRFFAGRTVEETAAVLQISARTVKRHWRYARAWLLQELREET